MWSFESWMMSHCGLSTAEGATPASVQTVNHDHMTLTQMFNVAKSPQFRLVTENPAAHVPKPTLRTNGTELQRRRSGSVLNAP
jgi:hypothetical protein